MDRLASLPLAEVEARLMLLPPISRGTHLRGPTLYAERLVELWRASDDVALSEAFRLLDASSVAGVLLRAVVNDDPPPRSADRRYWKFPALTELLPTLREQVWQRVLAGRFMVEGIPRERGKQHRPLSPSELPRFSPDWQMSRLIRDGRDAYVQVRVSHSPPVAPVKRWRKPPTQKDIKDALLDPEQGLLKTAPTLSGERLENALCKRLGERMTRQKARNAIKRWAPQTVKRVGRPRKKNSPK
jgi:hypothetical protein